jgi:hypothetical protein
MIAFCDQCFIRKSRDLHGSVLDDPVLVEYGALSLGSWIPTLRRNILPRNVGTQLPSDTLYPRRGPRIVHSLLLLLLLLFVCNAVVGRALAYASVSLPL